VIQKTTLGQRKRVKHLTSGCFSFQVTLNLCSYFRIPPDHWMPVGAVFLKLYLVALYNGTSLECFKANYDVEVCPQKMQLGWALSVARCLVNHSCDPNMYQVWYGTSVVFRAKRPIFKGEQLTFCYMKPPSKFNYLERQETYLTFYKFKCRRVLKTLNIKISI